MTKINLYRGVEYIQDFFRPTVQDVTPHENTDSDIRILSALCRQVQTVNSRNGKTYWYFFLSGKEKSDVVKYLLRRNGIRAKCYMSHCFCYYACPVVRVLESDVEKCPNAKHFIQRVANTYNREDMTKINEFVTSVRSEMAQHKR